MTARDEDAWTGYAAAVRRLDQLRREAAAAVVRRQEAATAAQDQIAVVRERVASQRSRFADLSSRLSVAAAKVEPRDADRAGVEFESSAADPTAAVTATLRDASATLDAADETLASLADRPARTGLLGSWPPAARNAIVYCWYAALATVVVVEIDDIGSRSVQADLAVFAIVLPLVAWALGWLSVGTLFAAGGNGKRRRSAWLGALICAIPLAVGLALTGR